MGNCKITTWKFKELPLQDPQEPAKPASPSNSSNSYHHEDENELFLVGYKHVSETSDPEIKVRLSDIMQGNGGDCDLALRYDDDTHRLYYSLDGDTEGSKTEWVDLSALDTSFDSIEFTWLSTGSIASARIDDGKLYLSLPKPSGSGGGSTLPINNVNVNQNAQTPSGIYEDGTLTLNLVPGAQGPQGQKGAKGDKGEDGASFKLYKVKLTFQGNNYTEKGPNNGITVYELNATRTWYKYNPTDNEYVKINGQPEITKQYVEIGPSDLWVEPASNAVNKTGWKSSNYYVPGLNAYFLTYGIYDYGINQFRFFAASDPTTIGTSANSPVQFSVKVYESIESADDTPASGGGNEPEPDDPAPTTLGYYFTENGGTTKKPLLTNDNITTVTVQRVEGDNIRYLVQEENNILYDGEHLLTYIPNTKKIDKVYGWINSSWALASDESNNMDKWRLNDETVEIGGVEYKVYGYYFPVIYNSQTSYNAGRNRWAFVIVDDVSAVDVSEGDEIDDPQTL